MNNVLLARFLPEARDLIQLSERGLLRLEAAPDDTGAINEVFRAFHTLKGSSGLFDVMALTRLMHAAEDLLGAVRAEHLYLDAELVDLLLDSLDQVKRWIDHLEQHERLPDDADRASMGLLVDLRARLKPEAAGAAEGAAEVAVRAPRPAASTALLTLDERFAAFQRLLAGEPLTHVAYEPDESCFFRGEDPLNFLMQVEEVIGLRMTAVSPWPALAELDPYRCNLAFALICAVAEDTLHHLFRYVAEQVRIVPIGLDDLLCNDIALTDGGMAAPALAAMRAAAAAGDAARLSVLLEAAEGAIEAETAGVTRIASCLPWLRAATTANAGAPTLTAILARVAEPPRRVAQGDARGDEPAAEEEEPTQALRQLLGAQELILRMPGLDRKRFPCVAEVLRRLSAHLNASDGAALVKAADAALKDGAAEPLVRLLGRIAASLPCKPLGRRAHDPVEMRLLQRYRKGPSEATAVSKALKVEPGKIDLLMNLIGELVVSKNALPFLARKAEATAGARGFASEVKELYAVFDRLAQDMQRAIMDVRMLPVAEVFDRFPRLVRDISRKLGKKIQLIVEGEDTAADKTIIDALGDPLLHIIRNAIDHGVEEPEERLRLGKPAEASLTLRAYQEADGIIIEIADDGRGIDPMRIRDAAVAKGLVGADRASRLGDAEALDLIFLPGFSTAREISDLSGRGVGMDVVRSAAENLGGKVSIASQVGRGTTVRLALPLTMAVTRVIVVKVGEGQFGIPMDLVVETVRVPADQIAVIQTAETFVLRDRIIPLARAAKLLGRGDDMRRAEEAVLVCRVNGATTGLVIDDFCGSMDIILKPLDGVLADMSVYSGTALLGDGSILLVLNLKELI